MADCGERQKMCDMRARGTGSFDRKTKTWRLRGRGIHVTVGQLQARYRVNFVAQNPAQLERQSAPYWRRYLQDIQDDASQTAKAASPYQERIRSLEATLSRLKAEGRSGAILERLEAELEAVASAPHWSTDYADTPAIHPDILARAEAMGLSDEQAVMLAATEPTVRRTPAMSSIVHEADVYIARQKAKQNKYWFQVRQAVNLFTGITGDIRPDQVTVHHFREAHNKITSHPSWGKTTQANMDRIIREFLHQIEADHNLTCYGFLSNKAYRIKRPKGQRQQYTRDQVMTALQHATGDIRTALLIGLNTGGYIGDIATMTPDMIKDGHLIRCRNKLSHKDNPIVGSWLLWDETRRHLTFRLKARKLQEQFSMFAKRHGIPPHKALRKTVAQVIHDAGWPEASRLYRGEATKGNHGDYYICDYTAPQIEQLDTALRHVARQYGLT